MLYRQSLAPHCSSLVLVKAWAIYSAHTGTGLAGDSADRQREKTSPGAWLLSAPIPLICLKEGSSPQPASTKRSPAQAWCPPWQVGLVWACACLCKHLPGPVAVWELSVLAMPVLWLTACLHSWEPPLWKAQPKPSRARGRLIWPRCEGPSPAAGATQAGQRGPGSSGFRLRAGSAAAGLLQGSSRETQCLLWSFPHLLK